MWNCPDNQEVGLEAAILQRKRNSSLVEWVCAENLTGLKRGTEAADFECCFKPICLLEVNFVSAAKRPRTKFLSSSMKASGFKAALRVVGEHCSSRRRSTVRTAGGSARAYADTSSENAGEKPARRKPKVSSVKVIC